MSAQAYAKAVPYARSILRRLLPPEAFRELSEAPSLAEALAALPESLYPGLREARSRREAEAAVWRGYLEAVAKAARLSPPHAERAILLYLRLEEARDLLILAEAVRAGTAHEAVEGLPTAGLPWSPVARAAGEPEALQSPQRLAEAVGDRELRAVLEGALAFEQRSGAPGALLLYYAPSAARLVSAAIESLPQRERGLYAGVVCPRVAYLLASGLLQAKERGVEARAMDEAMGGVEVCGFSWRRLRHAYEREPDPQGLAAALAQLVPGWRPEGGLPEILESARRAYRAEAARRARAALAGYPFQAGFIAAALELARLEAEDLVSYIGALSLGLKPEEYAGRALLAP